MKTTVKHVGSVRDRDWEGDYEEFQVSGPVIRHWCDGGEVEEIHEFSREWEDYSGSDFILSYRYRIKQREPEPGEVWTDLADGQPYLITNEEETINLYSGTLCTSLDDGFTYAAPSVESYYAREFLKKVDEEFAIDILTKAAQLDH